MKTRAQAVGLVLVILTLGWFEAALAGAQIRSRTNEQNARKEQIVFEQLFTKMKGSTDLPALMRSGATLLNSGYPELALPVFAKAATTEPIPPDAFAGAATALEALNNPAGALVVVRKGLEYNPIWEPLLERCIALSEKLAKPDERKICSDRLELLRAIPTWK